MNTLLDTKSKAYKNELMFQSLHTSKPAIKLKFGGATKQQQIVRSDQSRNYGGAVNIANALKGEAEMIMNKEYLPKLQEITKKQQERIAKGHGNKIPLKQQRILAEIMGRIMALKSTAKDLKGEGMEVPHKFMAHDGKSLKLVKA